MTDLTRNPRPTPGSAPGFTLQRRIMGRVRLIVAVVFLVMAAGSMALLQVTGRNQLTQDTDRALSLLTAQVSAVLAGPIQEIAGIANSPTARQFVQSAEGFDESRLDAEQQALQTLLLRLFDDLLNRHRDRYLSLRYITPNGRVWAYVRNVAGEIQIDNSITLPFVSGNPAYVAATRATTSIAQVTSLQSVTATAAGHFDVFIPVFALDNRDLPQGVLQLRVSAQPLRDIVEFALADPFIARDGRRVLLVSNQGEVLLHDASGALPSRIETFVENNPDTYRTRFDGALRVASAVTAADFNGADMPWRVVLYDDLMAAMLNTHILTLAAGLGLLVVGVLTLFIISTQLQPVFLPLARVSTMARRLVEENANSGAFDSSVPVERDEIAFLAHSMEGISQAVSTLSSSLEAQINRRLRDLDTVQRFGRIAATADHEDALYQRAAGVICGELGYYQVQIFLVDEAAVNLVRVYIQSRDADGGQTDGALRVSLDGASPLVDVARSGQPLLDNDPSVRSDDTVQPLSRARLALPLRSVDHTWGVLDIQTRHVEGFHDDDVPTLSLLADQLAAGLDAIQRRQQGGDETHPARGQMARSAQNDSADQQVRGYRYDLMSVQPVTDDAPDARALVSPITIRGETFGVLSAVPGSGESFAEGDAVILKAVADRVALAIENARLFQETQTSLAETSTLYQLSRYLNEANTLEDVMHAIITAVMAGAAGGQIWIFDDAWGEQPQWVELSADVAILPRAAGNENLEGLRLFLPDSAFLRNLQSNKVALINDVDQDTRLDPGLKLLCRRLGARSMVWIPLNVRGWWRGLMTVEFDEAHEFSEREGRIYTALIDQAGVAIDNRLLLQETERALTRNENLYAASRIINQAEAARDLVYAVVATTSDPSLNFALSVLEGDLDAHGWPSQARMVARSEGTEVQDVSIPYPLTLTAQSPLLNREAAVSVDYAPDDPDAAEDVIFLRSLGMRFMVTFPLYSANQPIALFSILSPEIIEMTSEDYDVYRALTGQMSSQLQIRRLLERTELALDETRRLYIASRAIASAQDSEAVYQASVEHLARPFMHITLQSTQRIHVALLLADPEADPDQADLDVAYAWSSDPSIPATARGKRISHKVFPFGELVATVEDLLYFPNIIAPDPVLDSFPALRERLVDDNAASALVVPLQSRLRWFGVILCHSSQPEAFNESYQRFILAVADQVSIAIENQTLFAEAQQEAQRAQQEAQRALALAEAAQFANRIRGDFIESLEDIFDRVGQETGFDRWMLVLYDDQRRRLNKVTLRAPGFAATDAIHYDVQIQLPITDAARLNRPLIVNDLTRYPSIDSYTPVEQQYFLDFFGKHVAAPVSSGDQVLGALFMGRDFGTDDLDPRDERLVSTLAAQVAVALENRRLFQQAQNEQRRLNSVLSTLPSGVLVLDPETYKPVLFNDQAKIYLGREIDLEMPFSSAGYNLFRTGTNIHYPHDELPVFAAKATGDLVLRDDVAVIMDGMQIDLLLNAAPIRDANGDITAIVATFQDISNLRALEYTLQENLRETIALYEAQNQLVAAGELNEVLDVIITQLALLQPDEAYVLLVDDDDTLRAERHLIAPLDRPEILSDVLRSDEQVVIQDSARADLTPAAATAFKVLGMRALISVPIRTRQRPIGWLVMLNTAPNSFPQELGRLLGQLSDVASTAIVNRYLLRSQQAAVQEIGALYNATTTISRTRDLEQLAVVLEAAMATLTPDYTSAYLESALIPAEAAGTLFSSARAGAPLDFLAAIAPYDIPAQGLYIEDLRAIPNPSYLEQALLALGNVRAVAAINLRVKDVTGGRLIVAYREPRRFSTGEDRFLNTIADSASVVLDNILLLEEIQTTLEETSVLYQASRALTQASGPEEILDVVVDYLIPQHVNQVFMALLNGPSWDAPGASVEVVSAWGAEDVVVQQRGAIITRDRFPLWEQLVSQKVAYIDDVYNDPALTPMQQEGAENLNIRSLTVLPLRVPKRAIGAIWLASQQAHKHNERELRVYQSFAEQASLSMEAAYLLQQTERRARQLQTSAEVSQSAGKILDLRVLLPQLVDLIRDAFGYDHVQIFLMDDQDDYAELRASTGEAGRQLLEIRHKLQKGSASVIGRVTADGVPVIALDTADRRVVHKPNPYLPNTRSEMALPLVIKGRVVGALDVQSDQPGAFTDEDVSALTTLAAQISVAIDNANLYQATQEQANQMSFLFEVTNAATSAGGSLAEVLEIVASRLHIALEALSVTIYLTRHYVDRHGETYSTMQAMALAGSRHPLSEIEEVRLDDTRSIFSGIAVSRQPVGIDRVADEPGYLPVVPSARSALIVPLVAGQELIGLVALESDRTRAFDADMVQLMLTLTRSLSAIVQSVQLLEQLQATNEQLRELDRVKSDFLANMSHELRTPLNSIIGFSRVMLKGIDGPLTEMQEQDLTTIFNSGQHLLMLINDVLDQAKIAAGKMDIKLDYFDMRPVIEGVKSIGVGLLKDKPISLITEIAPNMPRAYGDELRVRQVLINLVSNAAKFTTEGSVTIRSYPTQDEESGQVMVRVDVTDTGIGIAEQDLPLLFEAFRQVDSSLTRTQGGTGLGLPIAKSLVEMQGGRMTVMSQVNAGSTFSVMIPVEPGAVIIQEEQPEPETSQSAPSGRVTSEVKMIAPAMPVMPAKREVLLIEDNKDMVDQFRRLLQRAGFEVQTADHPSYAEAMVSNLRPTLIVMDVNFAGGEGWNILQRLKDRDDTFDIPVIVVTLSDNSERAYQLGAHTFITRPFVPDDLLHAVLEAEKESNTERILIIDDQPEAIRLLTQVLNENGNYRVFSAITGQEGIALVARRRPDLIILDLRMPDMDGFAVLEELRSNPETARIPVMVVTGEIDLKADEREQLANVHILHKTDISLEEYEQFIDDVQVHLGNHSTNGDG